MINAIQDRHAPLVTFCSFLICLSVLLWAHGHPDGMWIFSAAVALFLAATIHWVYTLYQQKKSDRLSRKRLRFGVLSVLWVALVLLFAYAQVPLFHTACSAFGFNGKIVKHDHQHFKIGPVDESRKVKLQAFAHVNILAPIEIDNRNQQLNLHPGEVFDLVYHVKNISDKDLSLRSVLSLVPSDVGHYLSRMDDAPELFQVAAGEEKDFEASFVLSNELPEDVVIMSLQFTLFNTEGVGHFGSSDEWWNIRAKKNHGVGLE